MYWAQASQSHTGFDARCPLGALLVGPGAPKSPDNVVWSATVVCVCRQKCLHGKQTSCFAGRRSWEVLAWRPSMQSAGSSGRPSWLHLYIGHWPPCFWEVAGFHGNWSVSNRMFKVRAPPYGKPTSNCLLLRADYVTAVNVFFLLCCMSQHIDKCPVTH